MFGLTGRSKAYSTVAVALLGLVVLLPACSHRKIVQLGTHKITVSRHGLEKRLIVNEEGSVRTLDYAGITTDGKGLKVTIKGDDVIINGTDHGKLRPGDSVLISDDGVAVNSLDYGESEKYLRANGSISATTVRN